MGTTELFLCMFLGHFIAAQFVLKKQHGRFFHDVPGFFDNIRPFPFERNLDFTPRDTVLSLLPFWSPDFHRLGELPPITIVPRVEVLCSESKLTLLVGKSSNGLVLTGEEIQLGDGCYSNRELPNKFVFTYSLDECGTTYMMQNGMPRVTNVLYFNLKKAPRTWWRTPTTVNISCSPKRSYPYYFNSMAFPENGKIFNIKAMNPSWTSAAVSNIYGRGQVVNLQVSAGTRPELKQQLFIQSCFVSGSPEPQTTPKHAVIMNKGCTAPLGSHDVVQFVASKGANVVNFVLNTAYLISELYIHCSVISDQGPNFGSKSCNYDVLQSRWEDLTGNVEVCECCSSKCKGLSVRHLPQDAKAIVSTGPLVILDKPIVTSLAPSISELQETSSPPVNKAMLSDRAVTKDTISGSSVSTPPGVVVVSQDPVVTLNLWLPGQVQDAESEDNLLKLQARDTVSNQLSELHPSNMHQEYLALTNDIGDLSANELGSDGHMDLNRLTLVDGWAIPPRTEKEAFAEESRGKLRFERSVMSDTKAPQGVAVPLNINVLKQNDFNQMIEELAVMPHEEANDVQPIIRSKLEFSKSTDGSQTLSYEEEVKQDSKGVLGRNGMQRNPEPRHQRLHSTFLALLRRMDRAE